MKLLFCHKCYDLFKLDIELRSCKCGYVKGKYINEVQAEVNGNGYSIAIGNGSLIEAIRELNFYQKNKNMDRDDYISHNKIHYTWVRPHEGEGNLHTKINKEL